MSSIVPDERFLRKLVSLVASPSKYGISSNQLGGSRKAFDKSGDKSLPRIPIEAILWQSIQGRPWFSINLSPLKYEIPVSIRNGRAASSCLKLGGNTKIMGTPIIRPIIIPLIIYLSILKKFNLSP